MDLEYWVDYVYLFGVKDMIPLYDKMNPIAYRNWDVYLLNFVFGILIFKILSTLMRCWWRCCSKKDSKVK
jgi:hypothetical protein